MGAGVKGDAGNRLFLGRVDGAGRAEFGDVRVGHCGER